jgi:short-subunit dehydrogenase
VSSALVAQACEVILTGRCVEALDQLTSELGSQARWLAGDLASLGGVRTVIAHSGRVDVLIALAGVDSRDALQDVADSQLEEVIALNLQGPLALARGLMDQMIERRNGHLVFVSSIAGLVASPGNGPVYIATKWGVRGLGLALRQELHGTGVGVSTIFPGPIDSAGMFARTGMTPSRFAGANSPDDVARAVVRAIKQDRAEICVAAGGLRLGATLARMAPVLASNIARRVSDARVHPPRV